MHEKNAWKYTLLYFFPAQQVYARCASGLHTVTFNGQICIRCAQNEEFQMSLENDVRREAERNWQEQYEEQLVQVMSENTILTK